MDKSTVLRYKGYGNTPSLFKPHDLSGFEFFEINSSSDFLYDNTEFVNQRLGKLVEEFVFYDLKRDSLVTWVAENLQIQNERRTIGELDALYYLNKQLIHLEIVYKFYLYDTLETYNTPLAYWIGPNRKDTLLYKLEKLKNKQFPLLYKTETQQQLANYNLNIEAFTQQTCFKAQLYLPYKNTMSSIAPLNENCISGFYISFQDMSIFEHLKFYIPEKLDWLIEPHNQVEWHSYNSAKKLIKTHIKANRSPLVWLKYNNSKFDKCFITFW